MISVRISYYNKFQTDERYVAYGDMECALCYLEIAHSSIFMYLRNSF